MPLQTTEKDSRTLQKADRINKIAILAKMSRWDTDSRTLFSVMTVCVCVWQVNYQSFNGVEIISTSVYDSPSLQYNVRTTESTSIGIHVWLLTVFQSQHITA
jgi:hypothetical protein